MDASAGFHRVENKSKGREEKGKARRSIKLL